MVQYQKNDQFLQEIDLAQGEEQNRKTIKNFIMEKFQIEVENYDLSFDTKWLRGGPMGQNMGMGQIPPNMGVMGPRGPMGPNNGLMGPGGYGEQQRNCVLLDPSSTIQRCFEIARASTGNCTTIMILSVWPKNNLGLNYQAVPYFEHQIKAEGQMQ